ncbi:hypothetical protein BgiMline_021873, partial [Biomphalaria glabrata]
MLSLMTRTAFKAGFDDNEHSAEDCSHIAKPDVVSSKRLELLRFVHQAPRASVLCPVKAQNFNTVSSKRPGLQCCVQQTPRTSVLCSANAQNFSALF